MPFSESVQRKIAEDNLNMQEKLFQELLEARMSHIKDLVDVQKERVKDNFSKNSYLASVLDLDFFSNKSYDVSKDVKDSHQEEIQRSLQNLQIQDRVWYTQFLARELKKFGYDEKVFELTPKIKDSFSICYYKNPYTDVLVDFLMEFSSNFKTFYEEDYTRSCLSVISSNADFTILPMKYENGKYIQTSLDLVISNNLTIVEMMPVFGTQNESTTYALVGKHSIRRPDNPKYVIELQGEEVEPKEIIDAVSLLGGDVTCISFSKDEKADLIFEFDSVEPFEIELYLLTFYPDFKILGWYQPDIE